MPVTSKVLKLLLFGVFLFIKCTNCIYMFLITIITLSYKFLSLFLFLSFVMLSTSFTNLSSSFSFLSFLTPLSITILSSTFFPLLVSLFYPFQLPHLSQHFLLHTFLLSFSFSPPFILDTYTIPQLYVTLPPPPDTTNPPPSLPTLSPNATFTIASHHKLNYSVTMID